MFEQRDSSGFRSVHKKDGAHYNIFAITGGMKTLREFFPTGDANTMNFVLFSTSGVHGMYTLIEEIEGSLLKYGDHPSFLDGDSTDWPDDYHSPNLTVLIVQPRIVCLRYGAFDIGIEDIKWLKRLRETSLSAMQSIGWPS